MRTVFNELETWAPKKEIGIQGKNKDVVVRLVESGVIINPENFITAAITTFDPSDDSDEATKATQHYLEQHELEMFSLHVTGAIIRGLVKPKDVPLKVYLEL